MQSFPWPGVETNYFPKLYVAIVYLAVTSQRVLLCKGVEASSRAVEKLVG
jgi:hypothetical protein